MERTAIGWMLATLAVVGTAGCARTGGSGEAPQAQTNVAQGEAHPSLTPVPQVANAHRDTAHPAFSPDGTRLAGGTDEGLVVWDVASGAVAGRVEGEGASLRWGGPTYSLDGALLAHRLGGPAVRVVDNKTYSVIADLRHPRDDVYLVGLTFGEGEDGRPIVASSYGGRLVLWDSSEGSLTEAPQPETTTAKPPIFYTPSQRLFFMVDAEAERIHVVGADGAPREPIDWPADLRIEAQVAGSETLLVRDAERIPSVWELREGEMMQRGPHLRALRGQQAALIGGGTQVLAWSDGRSATGLRLGGLQVWDGVAGTLLREFGEGLEPLQVVSSPDGRVVAVRSWDDWTLWDIITGEQMAELDLVERPTDRGHVAVSPDGATVVSTAADGAALFWDTAGARLVGDEEGAHDCWFRFSRDGSTLVGADREGVVVWDARSHRWTATITPDDQDGRTDAMGVDVSPDGGLVAVAFDGRDVHHSTVGLYKASNGALVRSLIDATDWIRIRTLAFSADGGQVLLSGHEGKPLGNCRLLLVDAETGAILWERNDCLVPAYSFPFMDDGRHIITQAGGRLRALDVHTGDVVDERDPGHSINMLQMAADGKMLTYGATSGGAEPSTEALEPLTWEPIAEKPLPAGQLIALGPKGEWVARSHLVGISLLDARAGAVKATLWAPAMRDEERGVGWDGTWVAYTPEGYWTGSDGAQEYLRWRDEDGRLFAAEEVPWLEDAAKVRAAIGG